MYIWLFVCLDNLLLILSVILLRSTEIQHYYMRRHLFICRPHQVESLPAQHPGLLSYVDLVPCQYWGTLAHIRLNSSQVFNNYHIREASCKRGNHQLPLDLGSSVDINSTEDLHSHLWCGYNRYSSSPTSSQYCGLENIQETRYLPGNILPIIKWEETWHSDKITLMSSCQL